MDKDDYVFCTECKYFNVIEKSENDYYPECNHKDNEKLDKCSLWDCDDSRRFYTRPLYEKK